MGRLKIEQYVKDAVEECPKALDDDTLLVGLVYEKYLGEEKAEFYGLRYCMENFNTVKLPAPAAVKLRKLQLIAEGKIKGGSHDTK